MRRKPWATSFRMCTGWVWMMHLTTLNKALIRPGRTKQGSDRFEGVSDPKIPKGHLMQLQTEEEKQNTTQTHISVYICLMNVTMIIFCLGLSWQRGYSMPHLPMGPLPTILYLSIAQAQQEQFSPGERKFNMVPLSHGLQSSSTL